MPHCLASLRNCVIGRSAFLVAWMMVPSGMPTLFFDGSPVGMAQSWGRMKDLVAPDSKTDWYFVHHAWSDCFSSPISSHYWFARLTSSYGFRLLNNFSSAHSRPSASSLMAAVFFSFTWRFLIWCFLIIWSSHLTFFFDKILSFVGGVWTGDLKMCEFWSSSGFELEHSADSRIYTFLFSTGFELEPSADWRICIFFPLTGFEHLD